MDRSTANPPLPPFFKGGSSAFGAAIRFEADVAGLDKAAFLAALAAAVGAPEYFGGNWDALADVLQDLSWADAPAWELLLRGTAALSGEDAAIAADIYADTARYWAARGKSFRVEFVG
jgi:hypothetical protein